MYGFLQDINGDKCEKRLIGLILIAISCLMCIIYFCYGLRHEIVEHSILDAAYFIGGTGGTILGITIFQKKRGENA